jgi:hypothetical protein
MGREEPGDSQPPIINECSEAWVVPRLRWGWFELPLGQGMNNLHMFAIEKKAQRMYDLKYNIKSYMF